MNNNIGNHSTSLKNALPYRKHIDNIDDLFLLLSLLGTLDNAWNCFRARLCQIRSSDPLRDGTVVRHLVAAPLVRRSHIKCTATRSLPVKLGKSLVFFLWKMVENHHFEEVL